MDEGNYYFRPDTFKDLRTGKNFQHLSEEHVKKCCNFQPCRLLAKESGQIDLS